MGSEALVLAFERPPIDWHAVAPELVLLGFGALLTLIDIAVAERGRAMMSALASIGLLAAMVPILTLALDGADRSMFGGAYVIDDYALIMKAVFVLAGYVVVLLSVNYVAEGDYWENEYYQMLVSSILGMVVMAQTDMKRLIAFSSVAHMGFVMLGIATLTDFGINAAIFGMVAHGIITGMLFFLAGSVKERYHTLEIRRLGGMLAQAPRLGWILGFVSMASLGLPGLAGFWGEFPAILSAYNPANGVSEVTFRVYMVIAAVGTVLAAGYLLWLLQRTTMGKPPDEFADDPAIVDVTRTEWLAWAPLLVAIVVFGVAPGLIFEVTDPAVTGAIEGCLQHAGGCDGAATTAAGG